MSEPGQETAPARTVQRRQPGTSGWALVALLCSVACVCPPLPLLGALFGIRALYHVRAVPGRRGRRLALAAIAIGTIATTAWLGAAAWWHANVRVPLQEGPAEAMRAGFAGDVTAFQAAFRAGGRAVPPVEAEQFLHELTRRYGVLVAMEPGPLPAGQALMQNGRVDARYLLRFTEGTATARAPFIVVDPGGGLVLQFEGIAIDDPERGEIAYGL